MPRSAPSSPSSSASSCPASGSSSIRACSPPPSGWATLPCSSCPASGSARRASAAGGVREELEERPSFLTAVSDGKAVAGLREAGASAPAADGGSRSTRRSASRGGRAHVPMQGIGLYRVSAEGAVLLAHDAEPAAPASARIEGHAATADSPLCRLSVDSADQIIAGEPRAAAPVGLAWCIPTRSFSIVMPLLGLVAPVSRSCPVTPLPTDDAGTNADVNGFQARASGPTISPGFVPSSAPSPGRPASTRGPTWSTRRIDSVPAATPSVRPGSAVSWRPKPRSGRRACSSGGAGGSIPRPGCCRRALAEDDRLWDYADAGADLFPHLLIAAHLLTPDAVGAADGGDRGRASSRRRRPAANIDLVTNRQDPRPRDRMYGAVEYAKDGLLPLTERLGPGPWLDRMQEIMHAVDEQSAVKTRFGPIPSEEGEVNGQALQVYARLYWVTGDTRYQRRRRADRPRLPRSRAPGHGLDPDALVGLQPRALEHVGCAAPRSRQRDGGRPGRVPPDRNGARACRTPPTIGGASARCSIGC